MRAADRGVYVTTVEQYQEKLFGILKAVQRVAEQNSLQYFLAYGTALGAHREHDLIPWDSDIDIVVPTDTYVEFTQALSVDLSHDYRVLSPDRDREYEQAFTRVTLAGLDHNLMHVDVFPLSGAPNSALSRLLFRRGAKAVVKALKYKRVDPRRRYHHNTRKRWAARILRLGLAPVPDRLLRDLIAFSWSRHPFASSDLTLSLCGPYGPKEIVPRSFYGAGSVGEVRGVRFPLPQNVDGYLRHLYGAFHEPPPDEVRLRELSFFEQVIMSGIRSSKVYVQG